MDKIKKIVRGLAISLGKLNKLSLPVVIIIASIILGGFFYASQVNKQKSIEKQQQIDLQVKKEADKAKAEQDKKEYVAKRKSECYNIYLQEKKNWSNVKDFSYSEARDVCLVKYKLDEPAKTKEKCGEIIKDISEIKSDNLRDWIWDNYFNCLENWFSKEF